MTTLTHLRVPNEAPGDDDDNEERALLRVAIYGAAMRARVDGATFILDTPEAPEPIWGGEDGVLWADGESLLINGPTGVGKTTIGQQLVRARLGLRDTVLGYPVQEGKRRLLYIAADRPQQAARSMRRMTSEGDRCVLAERLEVWRGPLPFDLAKRPELLATMCEDLDCDTVVIDSLKDVAVKLSDDEVGAKINQARQLALVDGVQVIELHHQRKGQAGAKPKTLDDVYGSTWITAGAGSVLLVWGEAGDAIVELSHLKQPADTVGPLTLLHDHEQGNTAVVDAVDLLDVVRTSSGLTAEGAAVALYGKSQPNRNEIERGRRQLERLVTKGLVTRQGGARGGRSGQNAARYYLVDRHSEDRQ
jgi:replicative DNA helicase